MNQNESPDRAQEKSAYSRTNENQMQTVDTRAESKPQSSESHLDAPSHIETNPYKYTSKPDAQQIDGEISPQQHASRSDAKQLAEQSSDNDIATPPPTQAVNAPAPSNQMPTAPSLEAATNPQPMTEPPNILSFIGRPDIHRYFAVTEGIPSFVQLYNGDFVSGASLPTTTVSTTTEATTPAPTTTATLPTTSVPPTTSAAYLFPAPAGKFQSGKYPGPTGN